MVGLVKNQGSIAEIIKHPKVQGIVTNAAMMKQLEQIDLRDLTNYLATGKSPKYDDEKILGRWQLHVSTTVTELKKKNPNLTVTQLKSIKQTLKEKMADVSLLALADNQVLVKGSVGSLEQVSQIMSGRVAPPAPRPGGPPGGQPAAAPAAGGTSVIVQGTWKRNDGKYQLTFNGTQNENANIRQGTGNIVVLDTTFFGGALVFVKAD